MSKFGPIGYCGQGPDEMFGGYFKHSNPDEYYNKINSNFQSYVLQYGTKFRNYDILVKYLNRLKSGNGTQETTHFDMWQELPNIQLWQYDRVSMAHGFELRVPYLDERIVTLSAQSKASDKIYRDYDKYILRKAAKKLKVPDFIWNRPKYLGGQNIIQKNLKQLKESFERTYDPTHKYWGFFSQTNWMKGLEPICCGMLDLLEDLFLNPESTEIENHHKSQTHLTNWNKLYQKGGIK